MSQESHFRAALFGGFQKSDVLAYIENLQNQILAMQGEQQQRSREVPAMRAQIEALTSELEQARAREHSFFDNAEELQRQIIMLEQDRDDLNEKLKKASAGQERVKDVEGQVGTLILDALLYSEKIISRAKETAQIISRRAQESVRGSATEVDGLGDDMSRISNDFSTSINQLVGRIKGVSADLSGMVDQLEPDLSDGSEQYEFNADGVPVLRETSADDDDSQQQPEITPEKAAPVIIDKALQDTVVESSIEQPEPFADIQPPIEPSAIPGGWFADAPLLPGDMPQILPPLDIMSNWGDENPANGNEQQ